MTILGKILAIFNVLAAVGFLYLAATDWSTRHKWVYGVYRHQLMLTGLPIDENESDATDDAPLVDKLSEKTLQDIFQKAGGTPVKTQKQEVQRAHGDFKSMIDGLGDEKAKRERLLAILLPLARTLGEREEMRNRIAHKPFDQVMSDVDTLFQISSKPAEGSLAELVMPREERAAIAYLLFTLYPNPDAQARLQAIVGQPALNHAINAQANHFHVMEEQTYRVNHRERAAFEVEHRAVTNRLRDLAFTMVDREFALQSQQREKARYQEILDSRQKEYNDVIQATEAARDRLKKTIDAQREEEQRIFAAQQLYHRTKLENQQLERSIRNLETPAPEGKKP